MTAAAFAVYNEEKPRTRLERQTMNIGRQWSERLRIWAEQFPKHYYKKYAPLDVEYATAFEHLSYEQAQGLAYAPAPVGTRWGRKWEYGWFRTSVVIPQALAGKRVVFTLATAPEMLVFVNGREAGSIDREHHHITLSRCAEAGARYEIVAECYAGHGVRNEGGGPVAFGEESVPEPPEFQVTVGESSFGEWNEAVFQAAMDYLTLYSLAKKLPERSLRLHKIVRGLKEFTYIADFELPEPQMTQSVTEARKALAPLLACKNGSTAPEFSIFGQSHIDLAWLWPVEETMRKAARTYGNQLALMEEYPEYKFLLCEPPIIEWLRELYPDVLRRVKERAAAGQIIPDGALWVEFDTNIPGGESLIRQIARGKRWFREEFGIESRVAWMPDTFGFNGALPQIMKKCGVPYFVTQKLIRQDPEAQPFPYNTFWWEGIDGSRVLAHTYKNCNADFSPGDMITRWETDRVQDEDIDGMMYPFGFGDGGGGATRHMLEIARRCADLEGAPRCRWEGPAAYFERLGDPENVFTGELYLAWHRGTLTSQAKTKRGIRKAEIALRRVEFAMAARMVCGKAVEQAWKDELDGLWKTLLFNQFHDIAPGSSIARVHERAEAELAHVCEAAERLIVRMMGEPSGDTMAYNHLSWPRTVRGVTIPAQGCARVPDRDINEGATAAYIADEGVYELKNGRLVCRFNDRGELISARIPGVGREYMSGSGNRLLMYKDVNVGYDAWEIGRMYESMPVALDEPVRIAIEQTERGGCLIVERKVSQSTLRQRIELCGGRVDFVTEIDWQEKHKLLKAAFPVGVHAPETICEIQFGYVKRPTHRSYQTDKDRYEVSSQRYTALADGAGGAAVLNDSKYGVSVAGDEIRLTLLRAPMMPDMNADRGVQNFTYSLYPFAGQFEQSGVLREAVELNEPPVFAGEALALSGILVPDKENIVVETVKPADTAQNALLVRAYEAMGMPTRTHFTAADAITRAVETDMLEENGKPVDLSAVDFGPFEIRTFLLFL